MKTKILLLSGFTGVCLISGVMAHAATADLQITLTPGTVTYTVGTTNTQTFTAKLTNSSATDNIFFNGVDLQLTGAGTASGPVDDNAAEFNTYNNAPRPGGLLDINPASTDFLYSYLAPGQTATFAVFTAGNTASTQVGLYPGTFQILGGEGEANRDSVDPLLTDPAAFSINVVQPSASGAVPEPSSLMPLGLGLAGIGFCAVRRRRTARK